ncbi:ABC transporter permease [Actinomycetota bacterium]|nr:ABC transporter permease [Actinomycetota bacterium]
MLTFVIRRLWSGVVLLFAISFIAYALLYLSSGDIGRSLLGRNATVEQVLAKNTELGLDRPLLVRYVEWLRHAVTGDFGGSWFTNETVTHALTTRLPVTLSLVVGVTVVSALVSFGLGMAAGVRRGRLDTFVQFLAITGNAVPGFLVALLLVLVFAVQLHWFPATGYVAPSTSPAAWVATVTLPIIALSIGAIAGTAQQVRSSVIAVLDQDYVRTMRSHGVPERTVLLKHVLRNASVPGLTVLALQFVGLLGGAVIVEQIFALPGVGALAVSATGRGDIPVVMGVVVATVAIVVVVNLLVDLAVGWLNPKARLS